ncbi:MAG TPA: oligosaccharide flippase family protein [Candidatus Paceibacterota bacterium]|nr:oligosaccharide flippase family protein [Candidatus Paceibacterota bacterium]
MEKIKELKSKSYKLLRWSEKYTKTDMVYLTRGGFWLTIGQGIAMLSGFLLSIAFANLFPKESFGTYKFILSIAGIMGIFSLTGLGTAIVQSVARGFRSSLQRGFWINLKWGLGILLVGLALSVYYYLNDNKLLSLSFLLVGIFSPLAISSRLYSAYLAGKKDFRKISIYNTIHNISPAIALIGTLLLTQNLMIIIIVYFLVDALIPFCLYLATKPAREKSTIKVDPELISYSKHLTAMEMLGQIAHYVDKVLIFHFLGAAPLAIYAFAIAPVEQLQGGKKILSTLTYPKLSEQSFEKIQKTAPRKAFLATIYAFGLISGYILLVPYFYKFFYPQYTDSILYSQVYSLTLLAISGTIFHDTLQAHKKKKELYIHKTIIPVLQITLFILLLPQFGLMGLVVTHVVIRSFSNLLAYYFVKFPLKN